MRGIHRRQRLVADPEPVLHVRSVVLHHDIGLLDHAAERGEPLRALQVQRDAALVAVDVLEVRPVPLPAHAFAGVRLLRRLDLDGVGAPVRELPHAGRARPDASQIEHGDGGEGTHRAASSLGPACARPAGRCTGAIMDDVAGRLHGTLSGRPRRRRHRAPALERSLPLAASNHLPPTSMRLGLPSRKGSTVAGDDAVSFMASRPKTAVFVSLSRRMAVAGSCPYPRCGPGVGRPGPSNSAAAYGWCQARHDFLPRVDEIADRLPRSQTVGARVPDAVSRTRRAGTLTLHSLGGVSAAVRPAARPCPFPGCGRSGGRARSGARRLRACIRRGPWPRTAPASGRNAPGRH